MHCRNFNDLSGRIVFYKLTSESDFSITLSISLPLVDVRRMRRSKGCHSEVRSFALMADMRHPHFVADKPFEAGKGIAHMVFVSHFLGDGRRGFDQVR